MYPIVLFAVSTLLVFVMLVAANPGNLTMHIFVSLFVGFVVTFFVLYQRAIDTKNAKAKRDLEDVFWMFKSV
jgi:hypothetical protein